MKIRSCSICRFEGPHQEHSVREMMIGFRSTFTYSQCSNCGCLQLIDPPLTMENFYPNDYYSLKSHHPQKGGLRKWLKNRKNAYALWGNDSIGRLVNAIKPNKSISLLTGLHLSKEHAILDVGCGTGLLLNDLKDLGFKNVKGIDPYIANTLQYSNGLVIEKKHLEEMEGNWDLIMFHHSLEHMPDPIRAMKKVHQLLNPGGHCLVRVPVADSFAWEKYKENWVQIDAPRHYHIFTNKSMHWIANWCELELTHHICDSTGFAFWGSEQYVNDIPLHDKRSHWMNPDQSLFAKKQLQEFEKRARELNAEGKGDARAYFFRKKK